MRLPGQVQCVSSAPTVPPKKESETEKREGERSKSWKHLDLSKRNEADERECYDQGKAIKAQWLVDLE